MEFEYVKHMASMDTDTLDAIMEHYGSDIWNYAYFLTGQHALADDIAQEVFIKAYYGIHTFRGQFENLAAYDHAAYGFSAQEVIFSKARNLIGSDSTGRAQHLGGDGVSGQTIYG